MWVDFTYYTQEYKGSIVPSDQFDYYSLKAENYVDYITLGKASKFFERFEEKIKNCVCAVAELQFKYDKDLQSIKDYESKLIQSGVKSEQVKSHSISFMTAKDFTSESDLKTSFDKKLRDTIYQYLLVTGLLYRGVCAVY